MLNGKFDKIWKVFLKKISYEQEIIQDTQINTDPNQPQENHVSFQFNEHKNETLKLSVKVYMIQLHYKIPVALLSE